MPAELGLGADSAAQQDGRREVGARCEHDGLRLDAAAVSEPSPDRTRPLQEHALDKRVAENGEVRPSPGGVEIRERGVPADAGDDVRGSRGDPDRPLGVVRVIEQGETELLGGGEERAVEGRGRVGVCSPGAQRRPGPLEVRRQARMSPIRPPLVVVRGRSRQHETRVVRRAAADHARSQRAIVLAARAPVVREHERPRIEQLLRPAAAVERPVVRAGLQQTNAPGGILRKARGHHTPGGAAADDQNVVVLRPPTGLYESGRMRAERGKDIRRSVG